MQGMIIAVQKTLSMIKDHLALYTIKLAMWLTKWGFTHDYLEQAYNSQNTWLHYKKAEKGK